MNTALESWLAHRPRRGATIVDTIVLHASGTDDLNEYIHSLRQANLSYHYLVDKSGDVHKCVPYSNVAFHAGNSWGPHEERRGIAHEQDSHGHFVELTTVNEYTLGVCLMNLNDGQDEFTREQLRSLKELVEDLRGHLPHLQFLTSHAAVAPGQHADPFGLDIAGVSKLAKLEYWAPNYLKG
jgi:N-acetyl-anhydromuramyl-L-alanine amidase AmpD